MDQLRTFRLPVVNLQQLRFVVAAADYGSIRQAAELLSIRHSTLSRTIRQLEDVIGVVVFERSGGGVEPTLAGRSVVRIARLILDQVDSLVDTGRSIGVGDTGRLSIGFSTSMSAGNLRATLLEFKTRFPNVDLMTVERSRVRLANALRCGTVDIVISPGSLSMADSTVLSLWSERILVALPESHSLLARNAVYWTDLRNETKRCSSASMIQDVNWRIFSSLNCCHLRSDRKLNDTM